MALVHYWLKLPKKAWRLGEYAFEDCTSLESVIMPEKLKNYPVNAFAGCTSLKAIIPGELVNEKGVNFTPLFIPQKIKRSHIAIEEDKRKAEGEHSNP